MTVSFNPGRRSGILIGAAKPPSESASLIVRLHVYLLLGLGLLRLLRVHSMKRRYTSQFLQHLPLTLLGIILAVRAIPASDWPQFRGPHRDGTWDESGILESFPVDGLKIRWRQPVGGG